MEPIKAIVVDDERHAADLIETMVNNCCPEVEVCAKANSVIEALKKINELKPDLLFLDIEMPYANGFDLLKAVENRTFDVVFITAYDRYAVQAFRVSAVDYLLKPLNEKDVSAAIKKVLEKRKTKSGFGRVENLMENISGKKPKRIALFINDCDTFVEIDDIVRFEADNRYTTVYMTNNVKHFVSRNIGEFEELLNEYNFFRIHRSHLINTAQVKSVHKRDGGYLTMVDGTQIEISRRKKDEFLQKLKEFHL
ncbi:MAG: hypothetical protein A2W91_12610 [Bacteroidetes bacterium GWF2_38_335]|nr:MAG: hypothetical protein A2W91_12610 [Bacteroidetes bacterium GWF2_38_335]OFY77008.1 MAG: hypothetical protein A2281_00725 [Bacteroidetes bacterium RIFOXYA12_FULL_38_20]HBS86866.1 DNA-binding response regulator [Bacteroidales bacterium]